MNEELSTLRGNIDLIDVTIIELIAKRQFLASQIAKEKKKIGMPINDQKREDHIISQARTHARKLNINEDLAEAIMKAIIKGSKQLQEDMQQ